MIRAVVVGSLNADLVLDVARVPLAGETLPATASRRLAGGKGANQAVALARLGAEVSMAGHVGDDADGRFLLAGLAETGVSTRHVTVVPGSPTGLAMVMVGADGENAIVLLPGANAVPDPEWVASVNFAGCDVVLAQLEIPLPAVEAALAAGSAAGALTVLNAAPALPVPGSLLALTGVLVVNEHEAVQLSGCATVDAAAAALQRRGARSVVVTLGAAGALYFGGGERLAVGGLPVRAVDTTGAGDCFAAALAAALASGRSADGALRYANAAAAIAVTRPGAQDAMPTASEVDAALRD
ncbi:MAG: ribokinase [Cryptosporangiaceae bacterium]|jgi:ribokinase|nr:ribokinase [Cryptosporangiaceae bacterium]